MKKLKLEVDALKVDSFSTDGEDGEGGTVRGLSGEAGFWSSCGEICTCDSCDGCEDPFGDDGTGWPVPIYGGTAAQ
jgi:hypothetical protein